jgi:hypothetical protein
MIKVPNTVPDRVLSFVREKDGNKVFTVINFSPETRQVRFEESLHHGRYTEYFSNSEVVFPQAEGVTLPPWSYRVYTRGP